MVAAGAERPRSRLTGRAAVLVLVLAVLTVSYASSLRAYLQQRAHINDLKSQIAEHEANIDALETEKERWDDPAYVAQQARERLGYVMPGEKTYLVLDEDGKPLEPAAELAGPEQPCIATHARRRGGATRWASVELAGDPPKPAGRPPRRSTAPRRAPAARTPRGRPPRRRDVDPPTWRRSAGSSARPARGVHAVAHRCPCGLPDVVATEPRLPRRHAVPHHLLPDLPARGLADRHRWRGPA